MSHCPTLPPCWRAASLCFWSFFKFPFSHQMISYWLSTSIPSTYCNFQINISSPVLSPELQMCMFSCLLHISTWLSQRHLRYRAELLSLPSPQTCSTPSNPISVNGGYILPVGQAQTSHIQNPNCWKSCRLWLQFIYLETNFFISLLLQLRLKPPSFLS